MHFAEHRRPPIIVALTAETPQAECEAIAKENAEKKDWIAQLLRMRDLYPQECREFGEELNRIYADRKNHMPRVLVFPWDDDGE
ncbi:MAG: hypothetical protein ACYC63_12945 [Armatimonadota bacterium]